MSDLTSLERLKLEKLFEMGSGYVLDFSNRTFQEFILETIEIDIYPNNEDYSLSKANHLRALWKAQPNYIVYKLIEGLIAQWKANRLLKELTISQAEQALCDECTKIAERLKVSAPVENIEAITPNSSEKDFSILAKIVRESIERNEPSQALDRLHTFVTKYSRALCDKHSIAYDKNTPLHALFGSYVRYMREIGFIESEMTLKILGSSIKILEAFNDVRNNKSFAHDNEILNYEESTLIFNNVSSAIRFINSIEKKFDDERAEYSRDKNSVADLPF